MLRHGVPPSTAILGCPGQVRGSERRHTTNEDQVMVHLTQSDAETEHSADDDQPYRAAWPAVRSLQVLTAAKTSGLLISRRTITPQRPSASVLDKAIDARPRACLSL